MSRTSLTIILAALVLVGFALRVRDLGAAGLSEDEVHKVEAARAYLAGDFSHNLEHPMLMKLQIAVCLAATDAWNARFASVTEIPEEVPVRLPNVIFGALTTIVLFLFGELFFGTSVGLAAAGFWATGVCAIAINRIAKEDTLLVFFYFLCLYFYERAKRYGANRCDDQRRFYGLAGASLGLMLASKYFPHYWGLLFLFYHFVGRNETNQPLTRRDYVWFYCGFAIFFLLFNPTVLCPSTLQYFIAYTHEETVTHHGYVLMGRIYPNNISATPGGLPIYFYPLLLALKTPIPILVAFAIGVAVALRRRRAPGYLFLVFMLVLWIVPYSIFAAKWFRYILSLLPIVYLCAAVGVVELFRYAARTLGQRPAFRTALATVIVAVFVLAPAVSTAASGPHYSLYLNWLGRDRTGYYFPHDEFYDAGLREAVSIVCAEAPSGAVVYGEAPPVFRYYQHRFGRDDLRFVQMSELPASPDVPPPAFVIVQDGRLYFENFEFVRALEASRAPTATVRVGGARAAVVYELDDQR